MIQREVGSDDYNQGYQDGLSGDPSNAGPRDGDALADYNDGYSKGQYEFSQKLASVVTPDPNSSQDTPPVPASPGAPPLSDFDQGYQDGLSGGGP